MAGSDTKILKDLFLDEIKECDSRISLCERKIREYSEELKHFQDRKKALEEGMKKLSLNKLKKVKKGR